jgi:16S rRNA (uracil1498-N3)-methyltransferase
VPFDLAHPFGQAITQVVLDDLAPARVTVLGDDARHLARVLRLRVGDAFQATDGRGGVARLVAETVERAAIGAHVVERATVPPPELRLWLVADADDARGDWVVEKAVELGAFAFLPVDPQGRGAGSAGGRGARWERLARAALKQSLAAHALRFPAEDALAAARARAEGRAGSGLAAGAGGFAVWIAQPGGADPLRQPLPSQGDLFLVSGGVSGIDPALLKAWEALPGAVSVGLGPLRLRAETAAVTLLALARARSLGGLGGAPASRETA